jgi:DMSO/TMAO reductase YedYZ heme-binding membrane subunit
LKTFERFSGQEMEENKEKTLENILEEAKSYFDLRLEHTRLSAIEKGARLFAALITNATVVVCFTLAFLFASFTLALFLSDVLGSYPKGFGVVAFIYLALSFIVFIAKNKYLEKVLINTFIKTYFAKVADKEDEINP